MTTSMKRVVIDTSVLIRYLIRPSAAIRRLIEELWIESEIVMVTVPELIAELENVLGRESMREFIHPSDKQALLDAIYAKAEIQPPLGEIPPYTRDPKDDKFVACAIAGNADCLITLDRDILELGKLGEVQMITPYDFVSMVA